MATPSLRLRLDNPPRRHGNTHVTINIHRAVTPPPSKSYPLQHLPTQSSDVGRGPPEPVLDLFEPPSSSFGHEEGEDEEGE